MDGDELLQKGAKLTKLESQGNHRQGNAGLSFLLSTLNEGTGWPSGEEVRCLRAPGKCPLSFAYPAATVLI
jgi:hypothetical protein